MMMTPVQIRAYNVTDKAAILHLLHLNTPKSFSPDEQKDLIYYLDNEIDFYFVLETDAQIVGCGGFNLSADATVGYLAWDIFHPEYQGRGLGSSLLKYRLAQLKTYSTVQKIIVRTSQLAYIFYQKQGFQLLFSEKDYWAEDFDLYQMEYKNR